MAADQLTMAETQNVMTKKKRQHFTEEQRNVLENTFAMNRLPNKEIRETLAEHVGVTETQVKVWFQNKRSSLKKVTDSNINSYGHAAPNSENSSGNSTESETNDFVANGNIPINNCCMKKPKDSIKFSADILEHLYKEFENNKFPDVIRRKILSIELGITERSVKIWFQNLRQVLKTRRISFQEYLNNKAKKVKTSAPPKHIHPKISPLIIISGPSTSFQLGNYNLPQSDDSELSRSQEPETSTTTSTVGEWVTVQWKNFEGQPCSEPCRELHSFGGNCKNCSYNLQSNCQANNCNDCTFSGCHCYGP